MLRELRKNSMITQKELGNMINRSFQTVSRYELGTRKPDFETFSKLCSVLKLNNKQRIKLLNYFAEQKDKSE